MSLGYEKHVVSKGGNVVCHMLAPRRDVAEIDGYKGRVAISENTPPAFGSSSVARAGSWPASVPCPHSLVGGFGFPPFAAHEVEFGPIGIRIGCKGTRLVNVCRRRVNGSPRADNPVAVRTVGDDRQ